MKIVNVKYQRPMRDIMQGCERWEINFLDHAQVALVDVMPRFVPEGYGMDCAVVEGARTSTGQGLKGVKEDRALVRRLMRLHHTSPFEMMEFKFDLHLPLFIVQQILRHRTAHWAHVNQFSARYAEMKDVFYIPTETMGQSKTDKQGSAQVLSGEDAADFVRWVVTQSGDGYERYKHFVDAGVSREDARIGLPFNVYTRLFWKMDGHNLLHFIQLREDKHAQYQIQLVGQAMHTILAKLMPWTMEAFEDYRQGGMMLSRQEIEMIRQSMRSDSRQPLSGGTELSKTERNEFLDKLARLAI